MRALYDLLDILERNTFDDTGIAAVLKTRSMIQLAVGDDTSYIIKSSGVHFLEYNEKISARSEDFFRNECVRVRDSLSTEATADAKHFAQLLGIIGDTYNGANSSTKDKVYSLVCKMRDYAFDYGILTAA